MSQYAEGPGVPVNAWDGDVADVWERHELEERLVAYVGSVHGGRADELAERLEAEWKCAGCEGRLEAAGEGVVIGRGEVQGLETGKQVQEEHELGAVGPEGSADFEL